MNSQRNRARSDLGEHEAVIETLAGIGSWTMDCRTGQMTWSAGLRTLLGLGADVAAEPAGLTACFTEPETLAEFVNGRGIDGKLRLTSVSIGAACIEMAIVTERDDAGQAIRATGVARDISEQVAVESAYQKQSGYLKGILSHLPQGITVFDETLRLKYWNDSATEVLALPPEIVVPDVRFEDLIM